MKLPNGYGSVVKLSGNRRKPYAARITASWTPDGKQKFKYIGYYETRSEALKALALHSNGDLPARSSLQDVYNAWSERKYNTISDSNRRGYTAAWAHLEPLHDRCISDIRQIDLQRIVDGLSPQTGRKVSTLLHQLYRFAIANDLCSKDVSRLIETKPMPNSEKHTPLSEDEIRTLWIRWNETQDRFIGYWLILIYTGLRAGELINIRNEDLADTLTVRNGKNQYSNRTIPVPQKIKLIIEEVRQDGEEFMPENYHTAFRRLSLALPEHYPHDARHTFATRWKRNNFPPELCRSIMGHSGKDINENVYTHFDIETMREYMEKLQ